MGCLLFLLPTGLGGLGENYFQLELRLQQHQEGKGANHTKNRLPIKLVYLEAFERIDEAFYREKQVQGWSRKKKEALAR